jgi:hypothetical protein
MDEMTIVNWEKTNLISRQCHNKVGDLRLDCANVADMH